MKTLIVKGLTIFCWEDIIYFGLKDEVVNDLKLKQEKGLKFFKGIKLENYSLKIVLKIGTSYHVLEWKLLFLWRGNVSNIDVVNKGMLLSKVYLWPCQTPMLELSAV